MISKTHAQAFYGVRPAPGGIRPRASGVSGEASRRISISSNLDALEQKHEGAGDDLYDVSSSEDSGDDLGWQSLPPPIIEAVPMQPERSCSPRLRLNLDETGRRQWKRVYATSPHAGSVLTPFGVD
jgi:hypothetical protein